MLISPLMSPIVGIGLSVGTYNWPKLISALRNFGVMVIISLISSYLYFLISPLKVPSAEIIARTEPTLLNVVIAFVGGFAGIIAITRKNMSNVIPGVAIATALMPPLCTAGYGLATLNFKFFWGGFYLFTLNSIMIALATYLVVNYLRFPNYKYLNAIKAKKLKRYISLFIVAIMIPSIIIFYGLVKKSTFTRQAQNFITEVNNIDGKRLINSSVVYHSDSSTIELVYIEVDPSDRGKIKSKMKPYGFKNTNLIIYDVSKSADERLSQMMNSRNQQQRMHSLEEAASSLKVELSNSKDSVSNLNSILQDYEYYVVPIDDVEEEITTLFPNIKRLALANIIQDSETTLAKTPCLFVTWKGKMSAKEKMKIQAYARKRFKNEKLIVIQLP